MRARSKHGLSCAPGLQGTWQGADPWQQVTRSPPVAGSRSLRSMTAGAGGDGEGAGEVRRRRVGSARRLVDTLGRLGRARGTPPRCEAPGAGWSSDAARSPGAETGPGARSPGARSRTRRCVWDDPLRLPGHPRGRRRPVRAGLRAARLSRSRRRALPSRPASRGLSDAGASSPAGEGAPAKRGSGL